MTYLTDIPCPFDDCGSPVEIKGIQFLCSTDPGGHTCVVFYQCLNTHHWMKDLGPDAGIDPALKEMYG